MDYRAVKRAFAAIGLAHFPRLRTGRYLFRGVLIISTVVSAGCLPGDPAKALLVANECEHDIWVRVREDRSASSEELMTTGGERIGRQMSVEFSVFDNDPDGLTLSVSTTETEVGRMFHVPHSEDDSLRFEVDGERCM